MAKRARTGRTPKWQVVENVVAAIEQAAHSGLTDRKVTQKAMLPMKHGGPPREVDVLVEFAAGARTYRLAIDVKNNRRPLDLVMLDGLFAKWQNLEVNRYVVVSTSGYTAPARAAYEPRGLELLTLEEVSSLDLGHQLSEASWFDRCIVIDQKTLVFVDDKERHEAMGALGDGELYLLLDDGTSILLDDWIVQQLDAMLHQYRFVAGDHAFHVSIDMGGAQYRLKGLAEAALPKSFICKGSLEVRERKAPVTSFKYGTTEALTFAFGDGKQRTLIFREDPNGSVVLHGITAPANPSKTDI